MKPDARTWAAPIVALAVLALVLNVTMSALRTSGVWNRVRIVHRPAKMNPYARLDDILASRPGAEDASGLRDPFAFGAAPAQIASTKPRCRPIAPPPPRPVLTAIVWTTIHAPRSGGTA